MAFALFLPGCSESGMRADQEEAEIPAGTQLHVRVNQNMPSTDQGWASGDEFQGTLARALQVNGQVIAPEGTIVKGELTNNLDVAGTRTDDTRTGDTGTTGDAGERAGADADRSVTGDPTMSADRIDNDRLGLELKKIVLNGEEYDIDTHAVPVPGMTASQSTPDRNRENAETNRESMAKSQIAGQEFVFTLEDKVELPSTTNMKTE